MTTLQLSIMLIERPSNLWPHYISVNGDSIQKVMMTVKVSITIDAVSVIGTSRISNYSCNHDYSAGLYLKRSDSS